MTLIVLLPLLRVIYDYLRLLEGGCPFRNCGHSTEVGRADEGDLADERVLRCHQDDTEVDVMYPSAGTPDQRRVSGEETTGVSYGIVVNFTWLLGEGSGREAVDYVIDRHGNSSSFVTES